MEKETLAGGEQRERVVPVSGDYGDRAARHQALARRLLDGVDPSLVRRVLEVCSGDGQLAAALAETYPFQVVGLISGSGSIQQAGRWHPAAGRLRFEVGELRDLSFADASFDLVLTAATYERLGDWEEALAEIARVLRPGGHLLWLDLEVATDQRILLRLWRHRYGLYTPEEVEAAHNGQSLAETGHYRRIARQEPVRMARRSPLILVKEPRAA
jgi:ubiquinone/menaquinone biosynthesis C-methylase UbiE